MKVTIHQPNFMPWLGLFHKAAMVDRFVVFDHVQAMGGSSWLTRNRILVDTEARWMSLPIVRSGTGLPPIDEVRIQWGNRLIAKQLRTVQQSYARHPHFDEIFGLISELYDARPELVSDFNTAFLRRVLDGLGFSVELVSSAELCRRDPQLRALAGNDLVVATTKAAGGEHYIAGEGCLDYIHPPAFEAAGVGFWFQRYRHPEYPQLGSERFVSHLSILDALFNVGFDGTRRLVEQEARERVKLAVG